MRSTTSGMLSTTTARGRVVTSSAAPIRTHSIRSVCFSGCGRGRMDLMTHAVPNAALADGHEIPVLGFGTWQITGEQAYQSVRTALEVGYRHIDTATMYQNESELGRAIADSGIPREELFITTKLPPRRSGRARETLDASRKALGT